MIFMFLCVDIVNATLFLLAEWTLFLKLAQNLTTHHAVVVFCAFFLLPGKVLLFFMRFL